MNVPNILTWARIVMIPMLVLVFYLPHEWLPLHSRNIVATGIFGLAAITDWLDGYLARILNQASKFGAFLDPVADKLMVTTALIMLVWLRRVDAFIAVIIIGREIAISALREWMANIGGSKSVAVSFIGKLKTVSQMVAIILLLFNDRVLMVNAHEVGRWLIYLAAVLTLWSMIYYLWKAIPHARRGGV